MPNFMDIPIKIQRYMFEEFHHNKANKICGMYPIEDENL